MSYVPRVYRVREISSQRQGRSVKISSKYSTKIRLVSIPDLWSKVILFVLLRDRTCRFRPFIDSCNDGNTTFACTDLLEAPRFFASLITGVDLLLDKGPLANGKMLVFLLPRTSATFSSPDSNSLYHRPSIGPRGHWHNHFHFKEEMCLIAGKTLKTTRCIIHSAVLSLPTSELEAETE